MNTVTHRTFPKSVQPGIPKIQPAKSGWQRCKIGDLFDVVKRPINMRDDIKYNLVTVKRSRGGIAKRSTLLGSKVSVKNQFELKEDDFLISKRQIVHGACAVVTHDFEGSIVSNEYSVLRCKPEVDLQFINFLSHSVYFQQTCFHSSVGVHVEKMIFKLDDWFKWPINLPLFPEQQKIAAFLGVLEKKLSALNSKRDLLAEYKRGLMQKLFSQELRFSRPDGSAFPDWEEKRLAEIAKKSSSGITAQEILCNTGEFPVFGASGFLQTIDTYSSDVLHIGIVKDGAGVGRVRLCPPKSSVLGTLDSICSKEENSTKFIFYLLSSIDFRPYIVGSTIPHIYYRDYSQKMFLVPHSDEQQVIGDALSAIDAKITAVFQQVVQVENFKNALLQQMFV